MNIAILDGHAMNPGDLDWSLFEKYGRVAVYDRSTTEEIVPRSKDADILVVNKVVITDYIMSQLPRLKMICVSATGYNTIDIASAHKRNIAVTNVPDYSSQSVAQMVFAHLLNICNSVEHYAEANRHDAWSTASDFCYQDTVSVELAGKVMGIIGFGNIGSKVARIALAFGMKVLAFTSKPQNLLPEGIQKAGMEKLLETSDVVTLHCPQTPATTRLIDRNRLQMMKPTAVLINTSRGGLVDEEAVAKALSKKRLKAYAADVMSQEPPKAGNPLLQEPNAFLTPHIAWATLEARQRLFNTCAENIKAFIEGHPVNVVS